MNRNRNGLESNSESLSLQAHFRIGKYYLAGIYFEFPVSVLELGVL